MKLSTFLRSLIPGVNRIHHGRARSGILIFFTFMLFLNGFLMAPFLIASRSARYGMLAAAVVVWVLALWDGIRVAAAETAESSPGPVRERVYDQD